VISKIANRVKVFKFCVLNVCKREYGISTLDRLDRISGETCVMVLRSS
jgi:hypothetical protein